MRSLLLILLLTAKLTAIEGLKIVQSTKQIVLQNYPDAFNPSIVQTKQGLLLSFRYIPDLINAPSTSYIGVVFLDENFDPISEPVLLNTRHLNNKTPSQSEDARLFLYRDRICLIYNDNVDSINYWDRRDMYIAELFYEDGDFTLSTPLKLIHEGKYSTQFIQKNWEPFVWDNKLLISFTVNPHEILYPNLVSGSCYQIYDTWSTLDWGFGTLRLSTPPQLIDGEYLAFFHSGKPMVSEATQGCTLWHYFMGAYTFSAEPPFHLTQMTPQPIIHDEFYTYSSAEKRVVFPGGFVVNGSNIYVAYGKDDCEIWIANINKEILKKAMVPITALE